MYTLILRDARTDHSQSVELFAPTDARTCSITLEPLGVNTETLLDPSMKQGPVSLYPELTAIKLPCGHCFNAMALLVHFAKNAMQCPLCRRGSRRSRLNLSRNFASETWPAALNAALGHDKQRHTPVPVAIPLHAVFSLYGASSTDTPLHKLPIVTMRCLLEPVLRYPLLHYRLPSAFARLIERQTRDMNVSHVQVRILHQTETHLVNMALMQTASYPFLEDFEPIVEPSSEHMYFENNELARFIYTPSDDLLTALSP